MSGVKRPPFVVKPFMFGEDCIGNDPAPTDENAPDYSHRIQEWFRRQEEHWMGDPHHPRTVTLRHGAVHVVLPDDCPCNPVVRVSTKAETDWRLGPGIHHVRVHPAIGQDSVLMEQVD